LISATLKPRLQDYIGGIVRGEGADLLEVNTVADHAHLLLRITPARPVVDIVRLIKANSSRWVNETFRQGPQFAWQDGYAAFTVSQSQVPRLLSYIRGQEEHHRGRDFPHELVALLRRNGVAFEERFLL
jgi:REP element-mobilizing transposase RayT